LVYSSEKINKTLEPPDIQFLFFATGHSFEGGNVIKSVAGVSDEVIYLLKPLWCIDVTLVGLENFVCSFLREAISQHFCGVASSQKQRDYPSENKKRI
jgi:hypothetical protein